jgi:hypothetical protein
MRKCFVPNIEKFRLFEALQQRIDSAAIIARVGGQLGVAYSINHGNWGT